MKNYKDAVDALTKAYQLDSMETLEAVRNSIYKDFGNTLGDNISAMAHEKLRLHK